MLYKPKYCCNCGERIERIDWKVTSSRKFCELCETEFKFDEILPRVIFIILTVFGVWGFGGLFFEQKTPVIISQTDGLRDIQTKSKGSLKNTETPRTSGNRDGVLSANQNSFVKKKRRTTREESASQDKPVSKDYPQKTKSLKNGQKLTNKTVYFCGAETKKGNPCSRRVKSEGRCWQHRGQERINSKRDVATESP